MKNIYCLLVLILFATSAFSFSPKGTPLAGREKNCTVCHSCEKPTIKEPCLNLCSREQVDSHTFFEDKEIPDFFILDQLSNLYVPVVFPHKLHADMEEMGGGCAVCHHHNPSPKVQPCLSCHGETTGEIDLSKPALKGAYHRQCLGCHREWSHETKCVVCHAKRKPGEEFEAPKDMTDIIGHLHPKIKTPEKWIYHIPEMEKDGPWVTFHHQDHVNIFELKCVDCHKEESCDRCHEIKSEEDRIPADRHVVCVNCHNVEDDCVHCHSQDQRGSFEHKQFTGFELTGYHQGLHCRDCHNNEGEFKRLEKSCLACHEEDWFPEKFDHLKAGYILDETHIDLDCGDCHSDGLGTSADCSGCHEKDWFPEEYEHSKTGLTLDETHIESDCADCHEKGLGKPASCSSCHDEPDWIYPEHIPGERN